MKISIIGLGLIGGSYALALKKRFEGLTVSGWDSNADHLDEAQRLGIIDKIMPSFYEAVKDADWIFLAIPVQHIEDTLPNLLDLLTDNQVVVDFGSTKSEICRQVENHPKRDQFIAAHPIAGTEYNGPQAAFDSLFENKVMIVCDSDRSTPSNIDLFRKQCKTLGMTTSYLSSEEHDIHLAYVSHLSHVISYCLSQTVLEKEEDESRILDLAGSGFESTVRLAKSSPEMWTPIFTKNKDSIIESLDLYQKHLNKFKELLASDDDQGLTNYLKDARTIRKILE